MAQLEPAELLGAMPALRRAPGAQVGEPHLAEVRAGARPVPLRALLEADRRLAEVLDAEARRVARRAPGARRGRLLDQRPLLALAQVGGSGAQVSSGPQVARDAA